MIKKSPSELVDEWVKANHLYLKDGGGAQGLHPKVREDLVARITAAFGERDPKSQTINYTLPPSDATLHHADPVKPKRKSKKATADAAK